MALSSRGFRANPESFLVPRRVKEQETSPERTRIWSEPRHKPSGHRKVPVVYYLCRNGQLDHPHFMEVTLSSHEGLYLRDVMNRLNDLRGKGMATLYSWSSKRSYKNGFVWHDLSENDFIFPVHGQEYVLKGSEILDPCLVQNPRSLLETSSFRAPRTFDPVNTGKDSDFPADVARRRNQSWSSIDLSEYKVYKAESSAESTQKLAADASTQTDDRRRRRKPVKDDEPSVKSPDPEPEEPYENQSTELSRDEISPPPSDSSPETLETLMKADGRLILRPGDVNDQASNRTVENFPSGRMRASTVLMQLISCGTMSFKECGPTLMRDQGLSLHGLTKPTLTRGAANPSLMRAVAEKELNSFGGVKLEDKEYFSGSLIETKKELVPPPALTRSSSYNADGSSRSGLAAEKDGEETVRGKCIPRKPKSAAPNKECDSSGSKAGVEKRH
ncbi:PREDICTED: protein UPSTREAM OF FLC [Tarenaya hassleriana]|uniref:protein UPSTREAM OF FLC n=1 Tax=Tarenaya hassleriana TaxID=28532 RepID=UPI00053C3152|nr:PREDICTED: protein UPSTREAM OF FLC [Tarenaya hassleriana]